MKYLAALLLIGTCVAQEPCVILRQYQRKGSDAITRWSNPPGFIYVEGTFPKDVKFRAELKDRHLKEIQQRGGKIVVLKPDHTLEELQDARKSCER